jgi:hypothetical protein
MTPDCEVEDDFAWLVRHHATWRIRLPRKPGTVFVWITGQLAVEQGRRRIFAYEPDRQLCQVEVKVRRR